MILNTLIHTFINIFTTYLHDLISGLLRSYDLVLSLCDAQTVPGLAGTPQADSFAPSPIVLCLPPSHLLPTVWNLSDYPQGVTLWSSP